MSWGFFFFFCVSFWHTTLCFIFIDSTLLLLCIAYETVLKSYQCVMECGVMRKPGNEWDIVSKLATCVGAVLSRTPCTAAKVSGGSLVLCSVAVQQSSENLTWTVITVFFTFVWPCIVRSFFIIKPTRCTNFTNLFWPETLHVLDISSVRHQEFIHCTPSSGIYHTGF